MPIRDDLILRMLDQIAEVVSRVVLGATSGAAEEAERVLSTAYQELTGSNRDLVAQLGTDQLLAILGAPLNFNRERGYVLGRLLEADAEVQSRNREAGAGGAGDGSAHGGSSGGVRLAGGLVDGVGDGSSGVRTPAGNDAFVDIARLKALDMYLASAAADLQEPDLHEHIQAVRETLADVYLPVSSTWRLFEYEVQSGRFAGAEDLLFELLDREGADPEVTRRGRRFYSDLEAATDAALEAGGLPRDEVIEGRRSFEERAPFTATAGSPNESAGAALPDLPGEDGVG